MVSEGGKRMPAPPAAAPPAELVRGEVEHILAGTSFSAAERNRSRPHQGRPAAVLAGPLSCHRDWNESFAIR